MPDPTGATQVLYLLDTSTISEIFHSYYQDRFPSLWEKFDELVRSGGAVSVRPVERELENARAPEVVSSIQYLRKVNSHFFSDPSEQEQILVREMVNDPGLSSAANRWQEKATRGNEDADPFLIAKARTPTGLWARQVVVTQESPTNLAGIPAVCQRFDIPCINLRGMMTDLGWQF